MLILNTAFFPLPSLALAVMVTVFPAPALFAVTTPFDDTVAYLVLLELQVTALLVALVGDTDTFSVVDLPAVRLELPVIFRELTFLFPLVLLLALLPVLLPGLL